MSTNPVARPQSRRGFLTAALAGTAAGAATFAGHVALAATIDPDPAEAILIAWINGCGSWNTSSGTGAEHEAAVASTIEAQNELVSNLAPSPMAAAVLVLNQMPYDIDTSKPEKGEEDWRETVRDLAEGNGHDARLPYSVLRCLRPSLTGKVAMLVADLLDNPDRPPAESLFYRAYLGEVTL